MKMKCKVLTVLAVLLSGCATISYTSQDPPTILKTSTQKNLDKVPVPQYVVEVKNEKGEKAQLRVKVPWYVALGGCIKNDSGTFERAPAGQTDQSTLLGLATRKYLMSSCYRTKAIRVLNRDPYDWDQIKRTILDIAGSQSKISSLSKEQIESSVWYRCVPPDLFLTGTLTEVNAGEKSVAAGISLAGISPSTRVVWTTVSGSLEITDPYTGELLVSVMGHNKVKAYQVGLNVFRIVSMSGSEKFLNIEASAAKEMIKDQVQAELFDYLVSEGFCQLFQKKNPEYSTERLHFRAGIIQAQIKELAKKEGVEIVGEVTPLQSKSLPRNPKEYIIISNEAWIKVDNVSTLFEKEVSD